MSNSNFLNASTVQNTLSNGTGLTLSSGTLSINNNAISNALLGTRIANSLLGNPNGTTSNVQDITLGTGLLFNAGSLLITTSGVTAGTYSSPLNIPQITVDALGRVSSASSLVLPFNGNIFINKFRNPTMTIAQRGGSGTTVNSVNTYTLDGWMLQTIGANCAWQQLNNSTYGPTSGTALYWIGNTGNVNSIALQRIEGSLCNSLAGQQVTVQAVIGHNAGSSVVPRLVVKHANTLDNWSASTTDVSFVAFQSCVSGTATRVAYTFACSSSAVNGLEISFEMNGNPISNSIFCTISDVDIRATPGVSTGLNNSPPTIESRHIAIERFLNQRYLYNFSSAAANQPITVGQCISTTSSRCTLTFPIKMRVAPTAIVVPAASNFGVYNSAASIVAATSISFINASTTACNFDIGVASGLVAGNATTAMTNGTVASILFTGAEL